MEVIFVIVLMVQAIYYTMLKGEIFGFVADWLSTRIPEKLKNPVYDCPVCMTPWYGSVIYWLLFYKTGTVVEWLVTIISAMGVHALIASLHVKVSLQEDDFEDETPDYYKNGKERNFEDVQKGEYWKKKS